MFILVGWKLKAMFVHPFLPILNKKKKKIKKTQSVSKKGGRVTVILYDVFFFDKYTW
jgi:hypothetical protein